MNKLYIFLYILIAFSIETVVLFFLVKSNKKKSKKIKDLEIKIETMEKINNEFAEIDRQSKKDKTSLNLDNIDDIIDASKHILHNLKGSNKQST